MIKLKIVYILIMLFGCFSIFGQDYSFEWNNWPSFGADAYSVKIDRVKSKTKVWVVYRQDNDSVQKKMSKVDSKLLYDFFLNYKFEIKGSTIKKGCSRDYVDTLSIPNSNKIIVGTDTINKELLIKLYFWDEELNQFYHNEQCAYITFTDGNTYEGYFANSDSKKEFSTYCVRVNDKDYELNLLMLEIISKYADKYNTDNLRKQIKEDQPRDISYIN